MEVLTKDTEGISWVVQMKQFLYICEIKLIIEFPDKILKVLKVLSVFGFVWVKTIWEGSVVEFVWYISIKPFPISRKIYLVPYMLNLHIGACPLCTHFRMRCISGVKKKNNNDSVITYNRMLSFALFLSIFFTMWGWILS